MLAKIENDMKKRKYLFEEELQYSKEERNAFLETLKEYHRFKNDIFRESTELDEKTGRPLPFSKKLSKISESIGQIIESAEAFTLKETEQWFDNMTVSRDIKELKNDYKLFQKTCQEVTQYQQRLESLYENIGTRLSRYYKL